jgi:hypothetical protein
MMLEDVAPSSPKATVALGHSHGDRLDCGRRVRCAWRKLDRPPCTSTFRAGWRGGKVIRLRLAVRANILARMLTRGLDVSAAEMLVEQRPRSFSGAEDRTTQIPSGSLPSLRVIRAGTGCAGPLRTDSGESSPFRAVPGGRLCSRRPRDGTLHNVVGRLKYSISPTLVTASPHCVMLRIPKSDGRGRT